MIGDHELVTCIYKYQTDTNHNPYMTHNIRNYKSYHADYDDSHMNTQYLKIWIIAQTHYVNHERNGYIIKMNMVFPSVIQMYDC